ncbi:hypothetical protein LN42_01840 [Marinitoga sp. 1137]|uniref:hypothetical protein n=1 Tax=Marinitoga sp. 1137 TaxID=1545835 RepID=UPI000950783A|nr:hypothetical protein [Marinitoga sp. 1137]APT75271.1 hypothetical protein LN42_01840 [Marinitoga sp. 1137]
MAEKTFLITKENIDKLKEMKEKKQSIDYGSYLKKIKEIKDMESKLREKRKQLEKELFDSLPKPYDKSTIHLEKDGIKAKVTWTIDFKISQKYAKIIAQRYPKFAEKVFSITYKPKKSAISTIKRTISEDIPEEVKKGFEELKEYLQEEEKVSLTFEKAGEKDE